MVIELGFILGKIAVTISGLVSVARTIEHPAENKQIKSRVPELRLQQPHKSA